MRIGYMVICAIALLAIISCNDKPGTDKTDEASRNTSAGLEMDTASICAAIMARLRDDARDSSIFIDKGLHPLVPKTNGQVFYGQLQTLLDLKPLAPIDLEYADRLYTNFNAKALSLEARHSSTIKEGIESRSLVVSIDELKQLVYNLERLQLRENRKTGLRIVFGSYDFENGSADEAKNGRMTVFLMATVDRETGNTDFNARTQIDYSMINPTDTRGMILNHGDLCPNNCDGTGTMYRNRPR